MTANRQAIAIITIGTEITTGQILDTNAGNLSQMLTDLRYDVVLHMSVRDEEEDILAALQYAASRCAFIVVTGGLGPTSDDKTRLVVAGWARLPLMFDEASWQHINARLTRLQIPVAPANRQQALFPKGARVITNRHGTANAFYLDAYGRRLWCLPGPPGEVKGLWQDSLAEEFRDLNPGAQAQRLLRYHMLGISESRLGEIVEECVAGSRLTTGYRPHAPYVEVKIWCEHADWTSQQNYLQRLEQALAPWLINRDDEDLAVDCAKMLTAMPQVLIIDHLSHGFLEERLSPALRREVGGDVTLLHYHHSAPRMAEPTAPCRIILQALAEDGSWRVRWQQTDASWEETLRLPYPYVKENQDRLQRVAVELSLRALLILAHKRSQPR